MSRANWKRVRHKLGQRDRRSWTEVEGGVSIWLALGNLGPQASLLGPRWQSCPWLSTGILKDPCSASNREVPIGQEKLLWWKPVRGDPMRMELRWPLTVSGERSLRHCAGDVGVCVC